MRARGVISKSRYSSIHPAIPGMTHSPGHGPIPMKKVIRMTQHLAPVFLALLITASPAPAQRTNDPFPQPIEAREGVIRVDFVEFASIPDLEGEAARPMILIDEPATRRFFVNDMRGPLYSVSYDGETVIEYVDTNADNWGFSVQSTRREQGMQSFAFHPQFGQAGTPGFGKFYTWSDLTDTDPDSDFVPGGGDNSHDTVLLEWTARTPGARIYDGGAPRELFRFEQPFRNHNGGQIGFNSLARPGDPDSGLLYVGVADGGSGGDPLFNSQKLGSGFGKIFRIDPLGSNSTNGKYGIPADNPFNDGDNRTLSEIYAYGVRNPQNFAWDSQNGNMFFTDIGQNIVEEISPVSAGANLGWNTWEGSFGFISRQEVSLESPRSDPGVTYPIAEYGQLDPLLQPQSASIGLIVYRDNAIPQLRTAFCSVTCRAEKYSTSTPTTCPTADRMTSAGSCSTLTGRPGHFSN